MQSSALELADVFSDHMVLQRQRAVPVWGTAKPGSQVVVTLGEHTATGVADAEGGFRVDLPALEAGGPFELMVRGDGVTRKLVDVLVGEVWLCSGQSNMEWPLSMSSNATSAIASADRAGLRLLTVMKANLEEPTDRMIGSWQVSSPMSAESFSAVGYHFGVMLNETLGVPVGLINASWGGTRIESWMPRESFLNVPGFESLAQPTQDEQQEHAQLWEAYANAIDAWLVKVGRDGAFSRGVSSGWEASGFDDSAWATMQAGRSWQKQGLAFNGIVWFRKSVKVSADIAASGAVVQLGALDDLDEVWVNGTLVGQTTPHQQMFWAHQRAYPVPIGLLKEGENTIAVRVRDHGGDGGMMGPADVMRLASDAGVSFDLSGDWRYAVEAEFHALRNDGPDQPAQPPTGDVGPAHLYNGMIHPLVPMSMRGAVWYQGESNAGEPQHYEALLTEMTRAWRERLQVPELAMGVVQLAGFMTDGDDPNTMQNWPRLREAQRLSADHIPGAFLAVAIDVGEAHDIHPQNKLDVGKRLALQALQEVYGKDIVPAGPTPTKVERRGETLVISYENANGLRSRREQMTRDFSIAGSDGKWAWADAKIEGQTVVLKADGIDEPQKARYGWQNLPPSSLENADGLPGVPFELSVE